MNLILLLSSIQSKQLFPPFLLSANDQQVDAVAADILNSNQDLMQSFNTSIFKTRKLTNPGLEALWEDERFRREEMGIQDQDLSPPSSPPRNRDADFETEVSTVKPNESGHFQMNLDFFLQIKVGKLNFVKDTDHLSGDHIIFLYIS